MFVMREKIIFKILLLVSLVITSSIFLEKALAEVNRDVSPTVINGFDWSLPANTYPESYSGLIGEGNTHSPYITSSFVMVRWDESNPYQGVYNFSKLEDDLRNLSQQRVLIRLEVNSMCEAPFWAKKVLRATKDKSLIFWDKNYQQFLKDYVQAFANKFAANPQIIGVQLGMADGEYEGNCDFDNKDGWGEFWMSPEVLAESERYFGLTPDNFEKSAKNIIDIYADAFGPYKYKLAYTNFGPSFSWGDDAERYNERFRKLAYYAMDKGVGNRDGGTEKWMRFTGKVFGNKITSMPDNTCRLDFDEHYAKRFRGRYWGSENEFFGNKDYVLNVHGPYNNQAYRFLISSLRVLQMRRNFVSISNEDMDAIDDPRYKTNDLIAYLSKTLGKQLDNTPDAFVLLGERYLSADDVPDYLNETCVRKNRQRIPIRSFGRWLVDEGVSKPAVKVSMPASEMFWGQDIYLPPGVDYEFSARKAKQFSFNVNDELANLRCATGCSTKIKITFKDTVKTALQINVAEGHSAVFQTKGDQRIKTVTFHVNSTFNNQLKGADFTLESSTRAIPVILTRIVFSQ